MVSSTLNPQAIIGNSQATFESFGNFMTGGNLASSSIVSNASNKIVNFNRPQVQPIPANISSLISNISTNILNQVDNSISNITNVTQTLQNNVDAIQNDLNDKSQELDIKVNSLQRVVSQQNNVNQETQSQTPFSQFQQIIQNIQGQISSVLENTLRNFSKDYQDKIKGFDDNRPGNVLSKFLNLYKNAIGFVNFFGDRKNIGVIETNLKALRKIFQESFEVAAVLRQTIIKIVKQLSNLPTASPTSGGLNLDIDVPGGRLRQGANAARIGNIARMGGIAGSSLLAAGGVAAAATGMGRAREYQESLLSSGVSAAAGEQYVPENIVESFSAIVDRFVAAVNSLISGAKSSSGSGAASGGGTSASPGGGPGSSPGTPPPLGEISGNQQQIENQMFDYLKQNYGENVAYGMLSNAMRESGYRTNALGRGGFQGIFQWDKTRWNNLTQWSKKEGLNPMDHSTQLRYALIESKQLGTLERMKSASSPEGAASIFYNEFERAAFSKPIVGSRYTPDNPHERKNRRFLEDIRRRQSTRTPGSALSKIQPTTQTSQVAAALTQTQANQAKANTISQPAQKPLIPISTSPTIIDAGGGGQAQQGSSAPPAIPSQPSGAGPEVPMLSTSNPDNFLTMYSRIVYNIVDG